VIIGKETTGASQRLYVPMKFLNTAIGPQEMGVIQLLSQNVPRERNVNFLCNPCWPWRRKYIEK
jgi:hypothetical protein